ncbi:uncharacterized protein LOC143058383 [Mytilus galloprovincialis]|uniref:uncharacterized protein LOC143058383 n=1 Tax=Mytilus galloprovincialis TaxID=29158 RepID=UPI003F7B6E70
MASDFNTWKKKELQDFLKKCNQPTFGNKPELIERAKGAKDLGLDINNNAPRDDIKSPLLTPLGEHLPSPTELKEGWSTNCDQFPDFTHKELYNFLVLSRHRSYDASEMGARRQLKAKVFYQEGHISNINCHQISEKCSHCIIKCHCLPSIPTKDKKKKPAYQTWVYLSKVTGRVHNAECNCVAGAGESCSHIAALLYGIADITQQKYSGKIAPTSKACEWIKPRNRNLSPKKSQEMVFNKFKSPDRKVSLYSVNASFSKDLSTPAILSFKERLMNVNPDAGWLMNFPQISDSCENNTSISTLPKLHNINFSYMDTVDITSIECVQHFLSYFDSLKITKDDCSKIEVATREQHKNPLWKQVRRGRLTASKFGNIVRRKVDTEPDNLIKYLLDYTPSFTNAAISWGKDHEQIAIDSYLIRVRESHPPLTATKNGVIINENLPHLGATPDGLVYCPHCNPYHGVIEVKCPYALRDMHPLEAARQSNFCCELDNFGRLRLKRSHSYYYQVQGQLAITKRAWCHFVVWTNKGMEFERICYDKELWENIMLPKLNAFFCSAIVPELFTSRVKRRLKLYN